MSESTPVFADGLGRRVLRVESAETAPLEHLLLSPDLAAHEAFTAALRERIARLHGRRLTAYARVQRLDDDGSAGLTLVSEYVKGWRVADLLDVAESENLTFDIGVVMLLLRQLLPSASLLSTQIRDAASGALGPEHLLLTPQGRLVLTDYVFGPAVDALGWDAEQLWKRLRIATPVGGGKAISQKGDIVQVGVTVLSLVVGRRLRDDEFPDRLEVLVSSARQKTPSVIDAPLAPGLRDWLLRALQLVPRSFARLVDAQMALERVLAGDKALLAQPAELDAAVARFERFMPVVELPEPPAELLLEAPPPDAVPLAVAFDARPPVAPVPVDAVVATLDAVTDVSHDVASVPAPPARKSGVRRKTSTPSAIADEAAPPVVVSGDTAALESAASPDVPEVAATADAVPVPETHSDPPVSEVPLAVEPEPAVVRPHGPEMPPAEREPEPAWAPPPVVEVEAPWWRSARMVAALAALAVLQALVLGWSLTRETEHLGSDGELVVHSRPDGATVTVDDTERGVTPLTLRLAPGTHVLQVRAGTSEPRVIPLQIRAGVQTAQYVEMQGVATTGVLEVRSEPARARVTIDGRERGSTPLTLRDIAPGDYQVVLERAGWKSTQTVRVAPGMTAQLVVPIR